MAHGGKSSCNGIVFVLCPLCFSDVFCYVENENSEQWQCLRQYFLNNGSVTQIVLSLVCCSQVTIGYCAYCTCTLVNFSLFCVYLYIFQLFSLKLQSTRRGLPPRTPLPYVENENSEQWKYLRKHFFQWSVVVRWQLDIFDCCTCSVRRGLTRIKIIYL